MEIQFIILWVGFEEFKRLFDNIYTDTVTDFGLAFGLLVIGTLTVLSRRRLAPNEQSKTSINLPFGLLLIALGGSNVISFFAHWAPDIVWIKSVFKFIAWCFILWATWVLPRSIKQRRANEAAVRLMKDKIQELEKLKNGISSGSNLK